MDSRQRISKEEEVRALRVLLLQNSLSSFRRKERSDRGFGECYIEITSGNLPEESVLEK